MEKNQHEDSAIQSAFQRLQQSGLLGTTAVSTSTATPLPVYVEGQTQEVVGVEGLEPVGQEEEHILVDAHTLLAKDADGNCSYVIIQMDENGDGNEQNYAIKVETLEDGATLLAESDVTQALLALPRGSVKFEPGNSMSGEEEHDITAERISTFISSEEAMTAKPQPFEILQSVAQAVAEGMVFDLDPPGDTEASDREVACSVERIEEEREDNTDDMETNVTGQDGPFSKETNMAKQFRKMTQIQDINRFLSAVGKCKDQECGCRQFHCPICPPNIYKPAVQSKLKRHLYAHWKIRIEYKDVGIVRCYRKCHPNESHFHCPECPRLFTKRNTFILHLNTKHGAGVIDTRAAENEKPVGTKHNPKQKRPKAFRVVMAVIGPETLDYLGSQVANVLEECQESTGVSYNMSEHNYCVMRGELEAIQGAYAIIDEVMETILKSTENSLKNRKNVPTNGPNPVNELQELTLAVGEVERQSDALLHSEGEAMNFAEQSNSKASDLKNAEDALYIPNRNEILLQHDKSKDDVSASNVNKHLTDSNTGGTCFDPGLDGAGVQAIMILDKGVITVASEEGVVLHHRSLENDEGQKTDMQETPVVDEDSSSRTLTSPELVPLHVLHNFKNTDEVCHPEKSVPEQSESNSNTAAVVEMKKVSILAEVVNNTDIRPSSIESRTNPRSPQSYIEPTSVDNYNPSRSPSSATRSWNLRRKRSTYRDYQSRMDALVKPWIKKVDAEASENVSDDEAIVKEEISDDEYGVLGKKRKMDDDTYVPKPSVRLVRQESGITEGTPPVVKRKRGRPRKRPLESDVVDLVPQSAEVGSNEGVKRRDALAMPSVSAKTVNENEAEDAVSPKEGAVVRQTTDKDTNSPDTVASNSTLMNEDMNTSETAVTDLDSHLKVSAINDGSEIDNRSALAAALVGDISSNAESPVPKNRNNFSLEKKSNVELDVIKDDKTGDIKLSLSVSFPKPIVKSVTRTMRINRRQEAIGKKKYACELCDAVFKRCGELTRHRLLTHNLNRAPRPTTVCDICGKGMRQKHLKAHIAAVHENEKPWECDVCQKSFSTHSYLKYHMSTHKDSDERARPHLCSVCGRGFYKISQLQDHQNAHTGSRPYKCTICKKTFPYRSAISKHMTVHSQSKPFECHICHKHFKSKDYLRNHQITHEPQSYSCPNCQRVYSYRHSLALHLRRCIATNDIQENDLVDMSANQRYMCGYCQEIFYDLETVQEHLTLHVQQETTTAEELLESLATAEPVSEEHAAAIHLETQIIQDVGVIEEDGLVPESTVIVQDGLVPESTIFIQEDGTAVMIQAEGIYSSDGTQVENLLVSDQAQVALDVSNIPQTVLAEVQTTEVIEVPILQDVQP